MFTKFYLPWKKNFHCVFVLFWLVLINTFFGRAQDLSGKITLELTSERALYTWGEYIRLELIIRNVFQETLRIPNPSQKNNVVQLFLSDEHGKVITSGIIYSEGIDTIELRANNLVSEDFSLIFYSNDTVNWGNPGCRLMAGKYKAQASLGNVKSNHFEFRVVEPTDEQRHIANEIFSKLVEWNNLGQAIDDGKILLQKHGYSVYGPQIYSKVITLLRYQSVSLMRYKELISISEEFLMKYPNSSWAFDAIAGYADGLKFKLGVGKREITSPHQWEEIEQKLNELKSKYPSERVSRYVDKYLKMSKEWEKQLEKEKK